MIDQLITKLFPFTTCIKEAMLKFLQTRYLKNRLRYEVDIWCAVSLSYEDVLINFFKWSAQILPELFPFCENVVPTVSCKPICVEP